MNVTIQVASILAVAVIAATANAQSFTWSLRTPASSPSPRSSHAMAFDQARQRMVLFGGSGLGDTWEWDGTNWTHLAPLASPSARSSHAMAYDSAHQRVVLFGGSGSSGSLGDTWEWDGSNWLARFSANHPSPRTGHAMVYDAARQRVVLFGGSGLGDTFEWDGTNWTQLSPSASPSARWGHAMAYDAARQRVVLFGGNVPGSLPSSVLSDTWEWDGIIWVPRTTAASPPSRADHAMTYDGVRQRTVLFGGSGYYLVPGLPPYMPPIGYPPYFTSVALGDTWEWDGTIWTQLGPSASPSARSNHAMAYDAAHQRVVLFGGSGLGDTWVNSPPITLASATAYGAGCGSPALGFVPDTNGRPVLGQAATATIVNAPTPVVAVAIGGSNQFFGPFALPVTLAGIGMPGCDLHQSADVLGLATSPLTPSTHSFSLAIPSVPSLIGLHLYLQAYAFAPGVNSLQIISSNGIDWLLGDV